MFDTRLKELRTGAGLTQAQLAKQLGVTQSTIGNWESGCLVPRHRKLRAKWLRFSVFPPITCWGRIPLSPLGRMGNPCLTSTSVWPRAPRLWI